jgi:type III secretion protein T
MVVMILPFLVLNMEDTEMVFDAHMIALAFKEAFVGLVLGFFISVPFWIAQSAGTIIDHQRGASSLTITDPAMGTQVSPIGLFYNYSLIALFYSWGGVYAFFEIVLDSYQIVRPDEFISASFFSKHSIFVQNSIEVGGKIFAMSVQFAAPSLLAILMADMFLGIANRLAPQVQITFLGLPLKSWLGLLLLLTSLTVVWGVLSDFSQEWVKVIGKMIRYMQPAEHGLEP